MGEVLPFRSREAWEKEKKEKIRSEWEVSMGRRTFEES